MVKSEVKQNKKEESVNLKGLLLVILFGTAIVVAVSFIGRIITET